MFAQKSSGKFEDKLPLNVLVRAEGQRFLLLNYFWRFPASVQRIGLFGMQIWGIRWNRPNDSEGKFTVYAEEHGFGGEEGVEGHKRLGDETTPFRPRWMRW